MGNYAQEAVSFQHLQDRFTLLLLSFFFLTLPGVFLVTKPSALASSEMNLVLVEGLVKDKKV